MKIILLYTTLLLAGCSTLDALSLLGGGATSGLEAELVVGSKEQVMENQIGDIVSAGVVNQVQEMPIEFMILLILGWLLPSPSEIWRGLVEILPWSKK